MPNDGHGIRANIRHVRVGFTLIEMLVTVSIIILVLAITFPFIAAMSRMMSGGSGANTVRAAVTAARGYATRDIPSVLTGTSYSGSAILFTPSGEMRLVENFPNATNSSALHSPLETMANNYNGYRDIPNRDYITLPGDTIVLGLARNSTGDPLVLTAPFAVRFDQNGQVIASANMATSNVIYYDANYDGYWNVNAGQASPDNGSERRDPYNMTDPPAIDFEFDATPYDPDYWNFNHVKFRDEVYIDGTVIDPSGETPGNYALPFEGIEAVAALLIISRREMLEAQDSSGDPYDPPLDLASEPNDTSGDLNDRTKQWVLRLDVDDFFENAEVLNFSRYTGVVLRDDE